MFKDKPVNHDPREVFIARPVMAERGEYNVFHDFYRALVQALYDAGVTRNVYCVNIDAVIAALLLKMLWQPPTRAARIGRARRWRRRRSRSSSTPACSAAPPRSTTT